MPPCSGWALHRGPKVQLLLESTASTDKIQVCFLACGESEADLSETCCRGEPQLCFPGEGQASSGRHCPAWRNAWGLPGSPRRRGLAPSSWRGDGRRAPTPPTRAPARTLPHRARFPGLESVHARRRLGAAGPTPETPILAASGFLIHRKHEIIRVYCIRQLSFRIICYTAVGN